MLGSLRLMSAFGGAKQIGSEWEPKDSPCSMECSPSTGCNLAWTHATSCLWFPQSLGCVAMLDRL